MGKAMEMKLRWWPWDKKHANAAILSYAYCGPIGLFVQKKTECVSVIVVINKTPVYEARRTTILRGRRCAEAWLRRHIAAIDAERERQP